MAPTICSGKKCQTRTIATKSIRRHGQGSQQLSQALSNIVNFVAKSSMTPRVSASLRIQTHDQPDRNINTTDSSENKIHKAGLNCNHLTQTNATSASNRRRQQFSFISDNAVTSSTHSDTENSYDLRLASENLTSDSTEIYDNNNTTNPSNATSLSPTQSPSSTSTSSSTSSSSSLLSEASPLLPHKEKTSSSTSQWKARLFEKYSTDMQANALVCHEKGGSDYEETNSYKNGNNNNLNLNKNANHTIHSSNIRKHYLSCNHFDSDEKELENKKELNSNMSGFDSDTDMDTDGSDSATSLDREKSVRLKRSNQLRDKLLAKQQTCNNNSSSSSSNSNSNNKKSFTNNRNTDGLLSIAIKTIKLVKRNQLLQQRLTQLQLETSEFIQSVLANPENRHFRENIRQKAQKVDNA